MRNLKLGHKEAQEKFFLIGQNLGYSTKLNYSSDLPSDGIWFTDHPLNLMDDLPILAIEVIVSESPKVIRGSIRTLENISPALAILLIHENEMINRTIKNGGNIIQARKSIERVKKLIKQETSKSQQRFELWNEKTLDKWDKSVQARVI